jgi:hypothetical protein
VIAQAAGLALLAALSPTALLVAAVFLGSSRPRPTGAAYLAGALLMSLIMGLVVLLVLRNVGLNRPDQHSPRYGLRLGLGLLLLAGAAVIAKRRPKQPDPAKAKQGILSRMIADPRPLSAFTVGLLLFAPGVTFIAAVQVIATAQASAELTALAVLVVVVINALLVWLPFVLYLAAPGFTTRHLTAFNGWLRAHGNTILIVVLLAVGVIMVFNGIHGLVTR